MLIYYLMLIGVIVVGGILYKSELGQKKNILFLLFCFLLLGSVSAFRYDTGTDYSYIYAPLYEKILENPIESKIFGAVHEPGFILLEKTIAFFSPNYQMLFIVTSYILVGLIMFCYWQNSSNVLLSVILFILLSEYYCSMNFIRQSIAGAIALLGISFIKRRKFFPFLLITLLASTFHKSALILIPVYFLCLIPFNIYTLMFYILSTLLIYFNTNQIVGFVTQYWYSHYDAQNVHFLATFSWPFTFAMLIQFLIVFVGSKRLREADSGNNVYMHYAFIAFFFTLMGTRHSILDRLSLYFEFAFPLSIPLIYHLLRKDFPQWRTSLGSSEKHIRLSAIKALSLLVLILGGGLSIHQYALNMDHHGVVPYQTICKQGFYKTYLEDLETEKQNTVTLDSSVLEQPEDIPFEFSQSEVIPPEKNHSLSNSIASPNDGSPLEQTLEEYLNGGN